MTLSVWDPTLWACIGFLGQGLFTMRFVVQWLASERKRESVMPVAFWWFSLAGGLVLLAYTIYRRDPPLILGQSMGVVVYIRNLMLVGKSKRRAAKHALRMHKREAIAKQQNANELA